MRLGFEVSARSVLSTQEPGIEASELGPVAWPPPARHQPLMTVFGHLAVAAIGQRPNLAGEELTAAGAFTAVLLGLAGDADGLEFIAPPSSQRVRC